MVKNPHSLNTVSSSRTPSHVSSVWFTDLILLNLLLNGLDSVLSKSASTVNLRVKFFAPPTKKLLTFSRSWNKKGELATVAGVRPSGYAGAAAASWFKSRACRLIPASSFPLSTLEKLGVLTASLPSGRALTQTLNYLFLLWFLPCSISLDISVMSFLFLLKEHLNL